ncbi:hypothetical protein [Agromyces humi]|uniref:hypothetical protein n=1 Tax=Agromyces humi TaxID=1766800 RepID=UPI001358E124|nr:hypothetical protein [Agromyces humi]
MPIVYQNEADDIIVSDEKLNGRRGAVNVTNSDEDIDITFEDTDTLGLWIDEVVKAARDAGFPVALTVPSDPS